MTNYVHVRVYRPAQARYVCNGIGVYVQMNKLSLSLHFNLVVVSTEMRTHTHTCCDDVISGSSVQHQFIVLLVTPGAHVDASFAVARMSVA